MDKELEAQDNKKVLDILKPYLRLVSKYLQAKMPLFEGYAWIVIKEITDKDELELLKRCLNSD